MDDETFDQKKFLELVKACQVPEDGMPIAGDVPGSL